MTMPFTTGAQLFAFVIVLAQGFAMGADVGDDTIPAKNEIVMSPGMRITATTETGEITVEAGKGLKRSYTWEGATRSVEMRPRDKRWYGSLGIYNPGDGFHWKEHHSIARCVVEEGRQDFKTEEDALTWIRKQTTLAWVWRKDGLLVGWSKTLPRKQLNVEVWQILIDGKKPTNLSNSQDDKIVVDESSSVNDAAKAGSLPEVIPGEKRSDERPDTPADIPVGGPAKADGANLNTKDIAALQGKWKVVVAENEGQPDTDLVRRNTMLIFEGDQLSVTDGFSNLKTRFTIDASKKPKTIDLLDGKGKDMALKGICVLDNDSLRLCQNLGEGRPTEFKSKAGDNNSLFVLKRIKNGLD